MEMNWKRMPTKTRPAQWAIIYSPACLPACLPLSLSLSLSFYPSDCMIYLSLFGFSLSFFYSIPLS